jgi:hypothetical protein
MTRFISRTGLARSRALGAMALLLAVPACSDFLTVQSPNVIDATTIDPVNDATVLANTAQQNFAFALGNIVVDAGWFVGETRATDTFQGRNDIARRDVNATLGQITTDVWQPLSRAMASSKFVLGLALPTPTTNINLARAALWRGYGFTFMAEQYCEGTVDIGPRLTTVAMLDSAIAEFTAAITVGRANGSAEAVQLANTALVGRARAKLQKGDKAGAATDADAVPAGFVFNMPYVDDLGNRARLGNNVWILTQDRGSQSVAPDWQIDGDPRLKFKRPSQHTLKPQDGSAEPFVIQDKYPSYASPIRVASKLDAEYIRAEAGTTAEQLALIARERAANGQPAYTGAVTASAVLTELMEQKGREFYLEGRRFGDWRRNPDNVLHVPKTGDPYFKAGFAPIASSTCYPLPVLETDNNPNAK